MFNLATWVAPRAGAWIETGGEVSRASTGCYETKRPKKGFKYWV